MVFGAVVDINQPRLPIGMKTPIFMGLSIGSGRLQGVGAARHQGLDATAEPVHTLREIVARRLEDSDIHCANPCCDRLRTMSRFTIVRLNGVGA
jgi:hypothetical protein